MAEEGTTSKDGRRVCIVWYRRDQWQLLRERAADPANLEDTYDEWLAIAEKTLRDLRAAGVDVVRMDCSVPLMINWCKQQGIAFDSEARSRYGADQLERQSLIMS